MEYAFGVKNLRKCDLKASAEAYLQRCGLTQKEIVKLAKILTRNNPMMAAAKTVNVSCKSLKKRSKTISKTKAFTVKYAVGKVTCKKIKGTKMILIAKNGKVTVKKGLKKKTYKVKTRIRAAGSGDVRSASKIVTLKIRVK